MDALTSANTLEVENLKEQIFQQIIRIQHQLELAHGGQEQELWEQFAEEEGLRELWQDVTLTGLHVLDAIGQTEPVNGITIARHLEITKGAVSKITQKLLAKKLIIKEILPDNKKEIYFRLTPDGQKLFRWHHTIHQELKTQGLGRLAKYSSSELQIITRFLQDLVEQS